MTFFIDADKSGDTKIFHSDDWLIRKAQKIGQEDDCLYEIVIMNLAPAIAKVSFTGFKKIMNTLRSKKVRNIYITSDENITFDYE
ncbi:hypothetical protein [uncultured Streptococcus sp.]|uniref:hypothetical protein n=1 Tax=uncultured Streptococcus sp. TaxID=83427 RepID=UPI00259A16C0|nr:hypothetical protein [uncultured Streptococcus sp.]